MLPEGVSQQLYSERGIASPCPPCVSTRGVEREVAGEGGVGGCAVNPDVSYVVLTRAPTCLA